MGLEEVLLPPDPWDVLPIHSVWHYVGLEAAVAAMACVAALWKPWVRFAGGLERGLVRLSRRPVLCFAVIVCAGIAVRLALLGVRPVPLPLFHDEFSYLLGADTFHHWRLTNPQPPFPQAFETIHVNLWPTYQSMYMPGTGLVLALGQWLGSPWIAVVATSSVFCAVVFWAVAAYLPRPYALAMALGAIGIAFNLNYWFDSYFCIGLQAIGGGLVLGSLPRMLRTLEWRTSLPLGAGLVLLMLTRPVEGAAMALPCLGLLLWQMRSVRMATMARLAAAPLALVAITGAWLLYYNWRGTGHATLSPYVANYEQYHVTGPFLFSPNRPAPFYRHDSLRTVFVDYELERARAYRESPVRFLALKAAVYYHTYLVGYGLLLLLGIFAIVRGRGGIARAPVWAFAAFVALASLMAWYPFPQYAAPSAAVFFLLAGYGVFYLRRELPGGWGVGVTRGLVAAQVLMAASVFYGHVAHDKMAAYQWIASVERGRIENILDDHPGRHICFVRYSADHPPLEEWVYNTADPAGARIVWVRSLGRETDRKIMEAFPGRTAWLLRADQAVPQVELYVPDESVDRNAKQVAAVPSGAFDR